MPLRSNFFRIKHNYEQRTATPSATFPGSLITRQPRIPLREYRASGTAASRGGSATLAPLQVTPPPLPRASPLLAQSSTQRPQSNTFTNVQTVSEMVVTRNVTSTGIRANREAQALSITTPSTITPLEFPATVPSSLPLSGHDKLSNVLSTTKKEAVFEVGEVRVEYKQQIENHKL